MNKSMQQLSIFDIPSKLAPPKTKTPQVTEQSLWFKYEIPTVVDTSSSLSMGDRVLILPAKYSQSANCPGLVKGFVSGEVLVRRRDGEGLYLRQELHRLNSTAS